MNNKGFTLIELMISVSLVSVVLVFTLNLLNDLRAEESLGTDKTEDLTNRTIITKVIQNDLDNHTVEYIGTKDSIGSGASDYCAFYHKTNFESAYDLYIKNCLFIKLDDGCRILILGTKKSERGKAPDYFAYGKRTGGDKECKASAANQWSIEKWKLSSASYDRFEISATEHSIENNNENNLSGDLANYLMMIKVFTTLNDSYATTSMNFDLEFIYYSSDVSNTSIFVNTAKEKQINGLLRGTINNFPVTLVNGND